MSIVKMHKVTFIGITADRNRLLTDLQKMGCVHIIPLVSGSAALAEAAHTAGAREAMKFLHTYPQRRRQVLDKQRFDAVKVQQRTLDVRNRLHDLENERDFLIKRIQDMRPWGDFTFPSLREMGNQRLWFYVVPHKDMPKFEAAAPIWEIIRRDNRFCYVAVVSVKEPSEMPVTRVHLGSKPRHELEARLEDVELAIEDAQAERAYLTRWHDLLSRDLNRLEDHAVRKHAAEQIYSNDKAFALQGWAPDDSLPALEAYSKEQEFYCAAEAPTQEDNPPTLMRNPSWISAGEDLVTFYMTPGYQTWDPSAVTFISFAIFFGMILADAGYAAVLALALLFLWNKMGRSSSGQPFSAFTFVGGDGFPAFWRAGRQLFRRNPSRCVLAWKAPCSEDERYQPDDDDFRCDRGIPHRARQCDECLPLPALAGQATLGRLDRRDLRWLCTGA